MAFWRDVLEFRSQISLVFTEHYSVFPAETPTRAWLLIFEI